MSIIKLKNKTGSDSLQEWVGFTFPMNQEIDLIDPGMYTVGSTLVPYSIGLSLTDLLAVHQGTHFEALDKLLKSGLWVLNDGITDLSSYNARYLIRYGIIPQGIKGSLIALESQNLLDQSTWVDGKACFTVGPILGKNLHLTGSKVIMTVDSVIESPIYWRVFVGNTVVSEVVYNHTDQLLLGADCIEEIPRIGNFLTTGQLGSLKIIYTYKNPIVLQAGLNMKLEIGFSDTSKTIVGKSFRIRFEGISENI